jgi:ABC-type multidrug transport system fused ATPase/permease subunit
MTNRGHLLGLILRLWRCVSPRRRRQLGILLLCMLGSTFLETVTLGLVLPFLAVLTTPDRVLHAYPWLNNGLRIFGVKTGADLILPLALTFALSAIAAGFARMGVLWLTHRLANATASDLSIDVYRRTLYQPYRVQISRNSSDIIVGLGSKVESAAGVLQQSLVFVSSIVLLGGVASALLAINAKIAIACGLIFGCSYLFITWVSRKRLARNAQRIARESGVMIKGLMESLGAIRDVLLDSSQAFYCDLYKRSDQPVRAAQANNAFISGVPRFVMEALGMVLIAALAYFLSLEPGGVAGALPVLGAIALGAQRLLPALQQCYMSWAFIAGNEVALADAIELLNQPLPKAATEPLPAPMKFEREIRFESVRMRYEEEGPWILDGIDLCIPKGARVGFVGSTGGGKSTLLDLLMGLLEPTAGRILVDDVPLDEAHQRAWQRNVAHVPQSIYLADVSFAENIATGVAAAEIDMNRVHAAAAEAQIAEFIESEPDGYATLAGERGVRLSGGQRQRVGIARALYRRTQVVVFDEATSALDNLTEVAVMGALSQLHQSLTLIIVAHRLTTVRNCDFIVELDKGRIIATGTYDELMERSPSFKKLATASDHDPSIGRQK